MPLHLRSLIPVGTLLLAVTSVSAASDWKQVESFLAAKCYDCHNADSMKGDVDLEHSCLRLSQSKEGFSVRAIGLPVVEFLQQERVYADGSYVFPGWGYDNAFGAFPNQWDAIFKGSPLDGVTAHVLRHSFASLANDLGYTEITIAALIGHSKGTMTSKYVHTLDTSLVMAADTIAGYVQGLLDGEEFRHATYALDHASRKAALAQFLEQAKHGKADPTREEVAA